MDEKQIKHFMPHRTFLYSYSPYSKATTKANKPTNKSAEFSILLEPLPGPKTVVAYKNVVWCCKEVRWNRLPLYVWVHDGVSFESDALSASPVSVLIHAKYSVTRVYVANVRPLLQHCSTLIGLWTSASIPVRRLLQMNDVPRSGVASWLCVVA